ncbi:MAG: hypothetical protein ACXWWQ_00975 [Candidatus Limnocylindria bacterium]
MAVELHDLLCALAPPVTSVVDSALSLLNILYSAGASNGLDPGGLAAGGAAAGAAGAGAAYGAPSGTTGSGTEDGTTGGSNVGRNDRTRPRNSTAVQARRDAQAAYEGTIPDRINKAILGVSETAQKWAEGIVGVDEKGTAPAGSKA